MQVYLIEIICFGKAEVLQLSDSHWVEFGMISQISLSFGHWWSASW